MVTISSDLEFVLSSLIVASMIGNAGKFVCSLLKQAIVLDSTNENSDIKKHYVIFEL